jgi:hypothetical protein
MMGIEGFEAVNSSTPAACRTAITEALNVIMTGSVTSVATTQPRNGYELVDACDFYNRGALQVVIKRAWAPQARWYGESLRFMLVSSAVSKARRPDPKQ